MSRIRKSRAGFPLVAVLAAVLAGCNLQFGKDIELSGENFGRPQLEQITELTGVRFPAGTDGLEYFFLGSGIDDALAAKVAIPDPEVGAFMENDVFRDGAAAAASIQIGAGRRWWNLDRLEGRVDRKLELPRARYLEVTCGREGGRFVAYLSWMTT